MKLKKPILAFAIAVAALFSVATTSYAAAPAALHFDGNARTFRGVGETTITADGNGYVCTLYNELGVKVGIVSINIANGSHNIRVLGGTLSSTVDANVGVLAFSPLDMASFPDIDDPALNVPARFQNSAEYELLIVAARAEDGANMDVTGATGAFRDAGVVEARCVYIVPKNATPDNPNKLPVFCLNCIFVIS